MAANNRKAALATPEASTPDLILMDVMPKRDGLELLELLHAQPQWKALPVGRIDPPAGTCNRSQGHRGRPLKTAAGLPHRR